MDNPCTVGLAGSYTKGYHCLIGLDVLIIGFLLVISARSNLQSSRHGVIFWGPSSRHLFTGSYCCWSLYNYRHTHVLICSQVHGPGYITLFNHPGDMGPWDGSSPEEPFHTGSLCADVLVPCNFQSGGFVTPRIFCWIFSVVCLACFRYQARYCSEYSPTRSVLKAS